MELTWPIDTYCRIIYGGGCHRLCHRFGHEEADKQIFLSTLPGEKYSVFICLCGKTPLSITMAFNNYMIFNEHTVYYKYRDDRPEYCLDDSLKIEPIYDAGKNSVECDIGQKVIAVIKKLPIPIANEIILHLRGSLRTILAETN